MSGKYDPEGSPHELERPPVEDEGATFFPPRSVAKPRMLGKGAVKHDARTLKLASYLPKRRLPAPPSMKNWGTHVPAIDWGMMVNDQIGDCTCAAAGHLILMDTTYRGKPFRPTDADIVEAYHNITGYTPGRPETDNGAVELDVLNYWRKNGIGGHKIIAFVGVPMKDPVLLRTAIWLFGSVYAGVALPRSAQDQDVWDVTDEKLTGDAEPNSWGGHAIPIVGYDTKALACVTWGAMQWMTQRWWDAYADEAYAVISDDWAPPEGLAPNDLNLEQLKADLLQLHNPA